ncbi:MAG: DegT/DnrJ/EryC1/StrS family aminotransferase [Spirochaetaceae bacterium]|jgi:dTDP-4-amino-4,6-dideoxygalactose transaminase|nr:DegT/DnrJ/EryC1/StrS family aminotransferase [Spirochaetaceae bacterium]
MKIEVYSPTIRRKEMDAVLTAMVEDNIGPGELSQKLVQTAREYLHFDYCIPLRSPAVALYFALKALDLHDGDRVLLSSLAPGYCAWVLESLRLSPVYCDTAPSSVLLSRETISAAARSGEKAPGALLVHHVLGFVPDMASLAETGIPIIEDCSRSYAPPEEGEEKGEKKGAVFSILGLEERDALTAGGGALLYALSRRDSGPLRNFEFPGEYSLPGINAALAQIQFKEAPRNFAKRRDIARAYTQASLRTRHKHIVRNDEPEYNNYAFPLILETGMKDVIAYGRRKEVSVEYAFADTLMGSGLVPREACPEAYSLSLRTALFPLYPRLSSAQITKVSKFLATLP